MSLELLLAAAGSASPAYVEDYFSTYLYDGNSSTQSINNGIDLAGKGGLVWYKVRGTTFSNMFLDTARGVGKYMYTESTGQQSTDLNTVSAFGSSGYTLGTDGYGNGSGNSYVSWTFRNAAKFFTHSTKSHTNGTPSTVDLSTLGTIGMVIVKRTDASGAWLVWHRSQTSGTLNYLNTTAGETTDSSISISGTTLTLSSALATGSYVVYAWAHDSAADGLVQCGLWTGSGVNLGWEPQFLLMKRTNATGDWYVFDSTRQMTATTGKDYSLSTNTTAAEGASTDWLNVASNGFGSAAFSANMMFLAVRRGPMRAPTAGTQVYKALTYSGNGSANQVLSGVGFPPDFAMLNDRSRNAINWSALTDRSRGAKIYIQGNQASAEDTGSAYAVRSFTMDGVTVGDSTTFTNVALLNPIAHFLRRYPGVFDIVCDTGTGSAHTIAHNLGVAPELVIRKARTGSASWQVWHTAIANTEKLALDLTNAKATDTTAWNSTTPGASTFTVGTGSTVNTNLTNYLTYLFATLAGISKVFSYTGNGSSQTINCGFSAGARFVLIKRTDNTGDWFLWDSTRGIVSGNDPHISLNSISAEVTSDDSIDPDASGFIVNQVAATNVNVNGATYVGFAIS